MFQFFAGMFVGAVVGAFTICLFVVAAEDGWRGRKSRAETAKGGGGEVKKI